LVKIYNACGRSHTVFRGSHKPESGTKGEKRRVGESKGGKGDTLPRQAGLYESGEKECNKKIPRKERKIITIRVKRNLNSVVGEGKNFFEAEKDCFIHIERKGTAVTGVAGGKEGKRTGARRKKKRGSAGGDRRSVIGGKRKSSSLIPI